MRLRRPILAALAAAAALALPAVAAAHIERPAYWPNPKPDRAVHPAAGGKVPKARSLASALDASKPGDTRVVCKRGSLHAALAAIRDVRTHGYRLRPTLKKHRLSAAKARRLARLNRAFAKRCSYHQIQPAVFDSRNNDRIVVMPGVYIEPRSRKQPTFDKRCQKYLTDTDFGGGGPVGLSYRYQWHCPNDQSLVALLGRKPGGKAPPPLTDRHGIPDLGRCVRCNVQIEGSGPRPEDTVLDSGRAAAGNGGPSAVGSKKDVALKADRADGFVLRNMTVRHAKEHDVYVLETDGYLLDHVKFFYAGEYGQLTFATDHGVTKNCEGVGNGDSAVYPGGAPESNDDTAPNAPDPRDTSFYPKARLNQLIARCDLHHNALGYSGTMGNATHLAHNNIFGNTTGVSTDSFFAGGHPGFPQSGAVFEKNRIYSNNFDMYEHQPATTRVTPEVPVPIGTGIQIGGGNVDIVRDNKMWNNHRAAVRLITVPDAIACAPGTQTCTITNPTSDSFDNLFYDNVLGRSPSGRKQLNGVDFWWDEFPTTTGNCWFNNIGPDGTNDSWTGDPQRSGTNQAQPGMLPENCSSPANVGIGDPVKESMLVYCATAAIGDPNCDWFVNPPKPKTKAARAWVRADRRRSLRIMRGAPLSTPACNLVGDTLSCAAFATRP